MKKPPAQQRHPDWGKKKMDKWDSAVSFIAVICMGLAMYILTRPEVGYQVTVALGTIAKVLFWWTMASIAVVILWNLAKAGVRNDYNRKRKHKEDQK